MLVLRANIFHFDYMELTVRKEKKPDAVTRLWIWLKIAFLSILEMLLVLPSINFFVVNMSNLVSVTEGMYVIAAFSISALMYVFLLYEKHLLKIVIDEVQRLVDRSKMRK